MNKAKLERMKSQMQPSEKSVNELLRTIQKEPTVEKTRKSFPWGAAVGAAACLCAVTVFAAVVVPVLKSPVGAGAADSTTIAGTDITITDVPQITTENAQGAYAADSFVSPLLDCEFTGTDNFYCTLSADSDTEPNFYFSPADEGTSVYPSQSGTVLMARWYYNYGYTVVVDHGNDVYSLYSHLGEILVIEGQEVVQSKTQLGTVGSTGWTTGSGLGYACFTSSSAVYKNILEEVNNVYKKIVDYVDGGVGQLVFDADGDGTEDTYYANEAIDAEYIGDELSYEIPDKNVTFYAISGVKTTVAVAAYAPDISKDVYALYSCPDAVALNGTELSDALETITDKRFVFTSNALYMQYIGGASTTQTDDGFIGTSNFIHIPDAVSYSYDEIVSMLAGIKAEPIEVTQEEVVAMTANLTEDYVNLVFDSSVYQTYNIFITRSGKIIVYGSSSAVYQSDSELFDSLVGGEYATPSILNYGTDEVKYSGNIYNLRTGVYLTESEVDLSKALAENVEIKFKNDYIGAPTGSLTATLYPIKDVDQNLAIAAYINELNIYVTLKNDEMYYETFGEVIDGYNLEKYLELAERTQDGKFIDAVKLKRILLSCRDAKLVEDTRTVGPDEYLTPGLRSNIFDGMSTGGSKNLMIDSDGYLWSYGHSEGDKQYMFFIGKEKAAELFACTSE